MNKHLEIFKDIHKNRRGFICCTGQSLADVDGRLLKGEIVISLNRGYIKKSLNAAYLVTADKRIEKAFKDEIIEQPCIKFCHFEHPRVVSYKLGVGKFSTDITKGMKLGHTVTMVALQIAYYMGLNPVYILGMDHSISYENTEKFPGKEYSNKGKDKNHFVSNYYPPGYRYRFQNIQAVENSYREAYKVYTDNGRQLYNASHFSKLSDDIIPRIDFEDVIWVE
jgi:hypothetical protein